MPTPGELKKIADAVAKTVSDLLSRDSNTEITAERLAEEVTDAVIETTISVYEEIQAKSYNLVVLGHFRISETESYVAAVGPLSTRATARARGVGEHFAWDYKTRTGTGKYVLVPLIRNPNEAWDHLRKEQRPPTEVQDSLRRAYSLSADPFGPACRCGRSQQVWAAEGGGKDDGSCPRHPKETDGPETEG